MSTAEILAELPKLSQQEVKAIYQRAEELLQREAANVGPELLAAIDEAEASPESEDIAIEAVRKRVAEWAYTK